MRIFRRNKAVRHRIFSIFNTENLKIVKRHELFLPSTVPQVYPVDQGNQINNPRTLLEDLLPVYGENVPDHVLHRVAYQVPPIYAVSFPNSFVNPSWGLIIDQEYALFEPSAVTARWKSRDLAEVPGISITGGTPSLDMSVVPRKALQGSYLLLNNFAGSNYGHFILDCLPGVLFFYREIMQGALNLVTLPQQPWQIEYLNLLGISNAQIFSAAGGAYLKCENIVWPSFLERNIRHPSYFTQIVGSYLTAVNDMAEMKSGSQKIYISRSRTWNRQVTRILENEAQLIEELEQRGFVVVRPEEFSVAQQISLFSQAKIVIGESGAAMANIIFAPSGCQVVEIMAEHRNDVWIKHLCGLLDLGWYCIFTTVPPEKRTFSTRQGAQFANRDFSYQVNIPHVLQAVDRASAKTDSA